MTTSSPVARLRRLAGVVAWLMPLLLQVGCSFRAVRAYEREHLASRIMTFEADARDAARRIKALDAREGSTGGNGGAGGGCACN